MTNVDASCPGSTVLPAGRTSTPCPSPPSSAGRHGRLDAHPGRLRRQGRHHLDRRARAPPRSATTTDPTRRPSARLVTYRYGVRSPPARRCSTAPCRRPPDGLRPSGPGHGRVLPAAPTPAGDPCRSRGGRDRPGRPGTGDDRRPRTTTPPPRRSASHVTTPVRVTTTALTTAQNALHARTRPASSAGHRWPDPRWQPVQATYDVNVRQPRPTLTKTNNRAGPSRAATCDVHDDGASTCNTRRTATPGRRCTTRSSSTACRRTDLPGVRREPGRRAGAGDGTNGCAAGPPGSSGPGHHAASITAVTRTYTATVSLAAVGGDTYTNAARLPAARSTTASRPRPPDDPNERVYPATASPR